MAKQQLRRSAFNLWLPEPSRPRPPRKRKPVRLALVEQPIGVELLKLRANSCRFPVTAAPVVGGFLFCGLAVERPGGVYCRQHRMFCHAERCR